MISSGRELNLFSANHGYICFKFVLYYRIKSLLSGTKIICMLNMNRPICKCSVSNQTNMSNVHPLDVVGRVARQNFK